MDFVKNLSIDKLRNVAEDVYNQAKPKTDVEARVYEVLSHKNWGSSSTLMNEVARDTFDYDKFYVVTKLMWEALENARPAAWRVVFKALSLLEHLIKNGSERCVDDARNHSHTLRSLYNFNYYEGTVDRGQGVREKSKQIVEMVGDDERVREERTKAKQLREKFGGNLGGVSNSGGGGGGVRYEGYGNDDFASSYGRSSGYGDGGIGSNYSSSGGGGMGFRDSAPDKGFSGRYSETTNTSSAFSTSESTTPAFAEAPEKKEKKKTKKSKKKKDVNDDETTPAPAPAIDLLAFDDTTPQDDSFDAFQSSEPTSTNNDTFDAFSSDQTINTFNQSNLQQGGGNQFDAFGSSNAPSTSFDAFASAPSPSAMNMNMQQNNFNNMNNMFGNMNMNMAMQNNNNNFGVPSMNPPPPQQQQMGMNMNMNSQIATPNKPVVDDDDFGDFADAGGASSKATKTSSNPLDKLISLDGLTKNKKDEDKTLQPIAFNDAAKTYIQNQQQGSNVHQYTNDMAFQGVDGINRNLNLSSKNLNVNNRQPGQPIMSASSFGSDNNVNSFMGSGSSQNPISSGMIGGNASMMNSMNMNNMGGMMGQQQGGMMMGNSNNRMDAFNGMNNSNMGNMGGSNGMDNMGGMMNPQRSGSMGMGGMGQNQGSNMMGGSMNMGQFGGNPMGGNSSNNNMMGGKPMGW